MKLLPDVGRRNNDILITRSDPDPSDSDLSAPAKDPFVNSDFSQKDTAGRKRQ